MASQTESSLEPWVPSLVALALGSAVYGLAHVLALPVPVWLPELRRWTGSPPEGAITISYYGLALYGLLGYGLGYGVGRLKRVATWLSRPPCDGYLLAVVGSVVVAVLIYLAGSELAHWA